MKTNADWLKAEAEKRGIPLRTLEQVKADNEEQKRRRDPQLAFKLARLQYRHGRLTDEAREWIAATYPEVVG